MSQSLQGIKGIGKKRASNIVESVRSTFEVQKIISELLVFGIYRKYGHALV